MEKPSTVLIDDTQFDVCENCSSLGKKLEVEDSREETFEKSFSKNKSSDFSERFDRNRMDFSEKRFPSKTPPNFPQQKLEASTLIEEFGKKIMQARQRKGLKLEELAKNIFEKESVIQRIEAEKFTPSEKMIKKLEKELEINLREEKE